MKIILSTLTFIMGFSSSVSAQIPYFIPIDSLVGWWPFTGNAKNIFTNNSSTIKGLGVSLARDRNNQDTSAFSFNGNGFIEANNLKLSSEERTISFWVKLNNTTSRHMLISYGICCNKATLIGFNICGSGSFYLTGGVANHSAKMDGINPLNWNHWVIILTKNNTKFYINGNYVYSTSENVYENTSNTSLNKLIFGSGVDGAGNAPYTDDCTDLTNGFLDDIAVWNRALDLNEVNNIYKECSSKVLFEPIDCGKFNGDANFKFHVIDTTSKFQWQINQGTG
jgi:hypothetical protein